jgi:hypothetical protein
MDAWTVQILVGVGVTRIRGLRPSALFAVLFVVVGAVCSTLTRSHGQLITTKTETAYPRPRLKFE